MIVLIGWALALLCVFGVFALHGGNLLVIAQALPFDLLTIGGAAMGAFIVQNQPKTLRTTWQGLRRCFKGSQHSKARYLQLLHFLHEILQKARREGLMAIEADVDEPHLSPLFKKFPIVGTDPRVQEFVTDYLRMMVSGNLNAHEIEALMDSEIETRMAEEHTAVLAMQRLAGALPAFGIVAAVLGVVNTMGAMGQPPAVLGAMIGTALVGTFLGILLAYGFAEPLAGLMEQRSEEASKELQCIKTTLLASMQGYAPTVAIEFGRKVLYSADRPSFSELEGHVKGLKPQAGGPKAQAAAAIDKARGSSHRKAERSQEWA